MENNINKTIITEINRINQLMGSNLILEAESPFLIFIKAAARGLEGKMGSILGRTINSVDDLTEKDIIRLITSNEPEFRKLVTQFWGISKEKFRKSSFEELHQLLNDRGIRNSRQRNKMINAFSQEFGGIQPKGGFPTQGKPKPSVPNPIQQQGNEVLDNIELDLTRIGRSGEGLTPEKRDFFNEISRLLKKNRLPKVSEKETDELIQNARALFNKASGKQFDTLFTKLDSITKKLELMTTRDQKLFLKQLIRETNTNPSIAKRFKNLFVPWEDSNWSTDFMKTWKDSVSITKWILGSSAALDVVRYVWDWFYERDFKGHFGTELPATMAIKASAAAVPYVNILTSSVFFLETVFRTIKGDEPKIKEPEKSKVEKAKEEVSSWFKPDLTTEEAKNFVENEGGINNLLPAPLTDYEVVYKEITNSEGKKQVQVWLDGINTVTLEKTLPLGKIKPVQ